ncbi:unnamed protein product, partial [Prorocentrum cordatum]
VEAPRRTDFVSRFADSTTFLVGIYFVILVNCLFMTYAADTEIKHYDRDPTVFFVIGELVSKTCILARVVHQVMALPLVLLLR